jgi:cell fate regulator YaaT (PSP1 superfamily)
MESTNSQRIIGVRFSKVGKIYYFDASGYDGVQLQDHVIVETSRGLQLGEIVMFVQDRPQTQETTIKAITRMATPRDLVLRQTWQQKEGDVVLAAQNRVRELKLEGVKIVGAEYSFDGLRLAILYTTESEDKVDLKSLRQDMQRAYGPSQVELRIIGPRDVAKMLCGMGACGIESRCCSRFLSEFSSISIRMAKEQGISLTPTEITGMCGRLRCCLIYEYEQYVLARQELPKRNKRVITPKGEGKVLDVSPIRRAIYVELADGTRQEFLADDLQPADELEALQKKAESPCEGDCQENNQ